MLSKNEERHNRVCHSNVNTSATKTDKHFRKIFRSKKCCKIKRLQFGVLVREVFYNYLVRIQWSYHQSLNIHTSSINSSFIKLNLNQTNAERILRTQPREQFCIFNSICINKIKLVLLTSIIRRCYGILVCNFGNFSVLYQLEVCFVAGYTQCCCVWFSTWS